MKKKKFIQKIGIVFFSSLIIIGIVFDYEKNHNRLPQSVKELIEDKKNQSYSGVEEKTEVEHSINELPSIREKYNNSEVMGRIQIPSLEIDTWITRGNNNDYYLSHNISHEKDVLGNPFFDYRNQDLLKDKQINIYGHNTNDKRFVSSLPFINLEAYVDSNIFHNYKDVYLSVDEKIIHYEVVGVKIITGNDTEHLKLNFSSDDDYVNHLKRLFQNTMYQDDVEISNDMRILVLQTCHYNPKNTYLLVICQEK